MPMAPGWNMDKELGTVPPLEPLMLFLKRPSATPTNSSSLTL